MENWPSVVPSKAIMPYNQEERMYVVVEENDIGTPKTRSRSSGVNTIHTFSLRLSHTEFEFLKSWVRLNLRNGTLPFNFPDPREKDGTIIPVRLMIERGGWHSNFTWTYETITITLSMEQLNG